ncbi:MAG: DNA internalization-related competence protein ComEC/Rec2 [candidate division KSB1 bacterium]|nr:DNA internalization-related competence protein ComEC/Rec2 [candidate division KSB1 bacterium]MDZ7275654.1 DNA internalization-related competence protein ComEC/Rec2 [candidate division KSB1 bacterium]MDZ7284655.1 DNA internalization-related competence protein ComEC/Rec2 [candidate division KSB1 bacterium]MDZ7297926.1 DNA internalization-related competence protein ComEC/Rec2 [candidate division KSB1 bacterium]MDZ7307109.1 DNA internalization-related competence protein ComEC/Rec2 [candidate div
MARRPVFFLALALSLGIFIQRRCDLPATFLSAAFAFSLLTAGLLFFAARSPSRNSTPWLLLACLLAGMLRLHLEERPGVGEVSSRVDDTREVWLLGTVASVPEARPNSWRFRCRALAIWTAGTVERIHGAVLAYLKTAEPPAVSETLIMRGRLVLPDASRNPGAFDYRAYLKAAGINAIFFASDSLQWCSGKTARFSGDRLVAQVKIWMESRLAHFASGQELALLQALLLGNRTSLEDEVIENFSRTGLIHVLAVSGLHVGFIALILVVLVELVRVPRRWQWPVLVAGLTFYAVLTGLQPPVLRATVMAAVVLLGRALQRSVSIYNSLGIAAVLILLWQPLQLFQIGFQLSFVAVLGIVYLYRPLLFHLAKLPGSRLPGMRPAVALLAVSLAAQLATVPLTAMAFGRVPLLAIVGNLLVIPASFVLVAASAVGCLAAVFSDFVALAFGSVAQLMAAGLISLTRWLADLPLAYVDGAALPGLFWLAYTLLGAALIEWRRRPRRLLLPLGLLTLNCCVWLAALATAPRLRITFFDVGQGDAILLEFPQRREMLIDAGPANEFTTAAENALLPYLRRRGIRRLEAVLITHPHADHLGGLPSLLRACAIESVYFCGREADSDLEQACERLLDSLRITQRLLRAGDRLSGFPGAQLTVLHTGALLDAVPSLNDASIVLKVLFGEVSLLFPGDAEGWSESRLLQHAPALASDLLKVGHHGSRTSSTPAFLAAVSPRWAVISAGRRNTFGHPDSLILARCDSLGIAWLRTDQSGAIVFESDGRELWRVR